MRKVSQVAAGVTTMGAVSMISAQGMKVMNQGQRNSKQLTLRMTMIQTGSLSGRSIPTLWVNLALICLLLMLLRILGEIWKLTLKKKKHQK